MGSPLPLLTETQFVQRLRQISPAACPDSTPCPNSSLHVLHRHYSELRRWNPRLSLVGPGTASEVLERHYGESLAALPLIRSSDRSLLDIGAGAGFPGLVLAVALPSLDVTLVEPRERKWAFLKTAVRQCGLSTLCLNVRVGIPLPRELPREIDIMTCRAVSLPARLLEALIEVSPRVRMLIWSGARIPELPGNCRVEREVPLPSSKHRRILEIVAR